MSDPGYTVAPLQSSDYEEALSLLRRTFFTDEPLNKAVELCPEGTQCAELEDYARKDLESGLSFKAVDGNGKIVGLCINGISNIKEEDNGNDLFSQAQKCNNPKFQKILYILSKREQGARLWERFPNDQKLIDIKMTATDPSWRRKGIMSRLVQETEHLVKTRDDISLLRLDTSSYYSAMSAERCGFTCVYKVLYSDLKMDGKPLIVPPPPHVDDRVYIKRIK